MYHPTARVVPTRVVPTRTPRRRGVDPTPAAACRSRNFCDSAHAFASGAGSDGVFGGSGAAGAGGGSLQRSSREIDGGGVGIRGALALGSVRGSSDATLTTTGRSEFGLCNRS